MSLKFKNERILRKSYKYFAIAAFYFMSKHCYLYYKKNYPEKLTIKLNNHLENSIFDSKVFRDCCNVSTGTIFEIYLESYLFITNNKIHFEKKNIAKSEFLNEK